MMLFGDWLEETRKLQRETYGRDPATLVGDERASYFREMAAALVFELGEASNEIGWKSWGSDRALNKPAYLGEMVDLLHFACNLLILADITDDELNEAYLAKMALNRKRQSSGAYAGRDAGKCLHCKRALDDPATSCVVGCCRAPGGPTVAIGGIA